jgi:hypothetical protein
MAKYFHRLGTDKRDFQVSLRLVSLRADITESTFFSVQWKRGAHADDTSVMEMGSAEKSVACEKTFTKVISVFQDPKSGKYLKKEVTNYIESDRHV